jgi:hypothetical protein
MTNLPTTLWGAINRAKLELRKFHLEENQKKKDQQKLKAIAAMENADKVIGPGPHKYMSSRHNWRNEVLYLNYYEDDTRVGRYWEDDNVKWSLDAIPTWALNKDLKKQEPKFGDTINVRGTMFTYSVRPQHQSR